MIVSAAVASTLAIPQYSRSSQLVNSGAHANAKANGQSRCRHPDPYADLRPHRSAQPHTRPQPHHRRGRPRSPDPQRPTTPELQPL